ncbi:hypothetical protein FK220_019490 [Flavobacteriaceae bacterium TP-CH-4]|uniref:Pectate lyase n=1 Tax=Pelagihabitans pacificus TaxID=2696054 RepID=A0A967E8C9_9FLAO|nr:hypothetical protein [Pelagihabitans pacificus]NHF61545.1 hypothetical protein [Pelagihabitans pacificus]
MNIKSPSPVVMLYFFVFFVSISCTKDSDLLSDYVSTELQPDLVFKTFVVDDRFSTTPETSITVDVLENDTFSDEANVKIIGVSEPANGTVEINEDKTITYTPNPPDENDTTADTTDTTDTSDDTTDTPEDTTDTTEETTDTFTYTTEVVNEDETVTVEEGTVTVEIIDYGELKAFPSAYGFGKNTTGGRGGYVVEVTNLNDRGAGSLREALKMTGTRTIVFRVGGTINCSSYLDIPQGSGNVTIAGQTAPGEGILIKGAELRISASNVIVRYLRIRPGSGTNGSNEDGINISAYNGDNLQNIIIDHCSISWARDENFALVGGFSGSTIKNVTLQNSIISESGYGALNYKGTSNITYFGNLFALNSERNIRANHPVSNALDFEMINNLVYGGKWRTNVSLGSKFSAINNKYKASNQVDSRGSVSVHGESDGTGEAGETYAFITGNIQISGQSEYSGNLSNYLKSSAFSDSGTAAAAIPANQLEANLLNVVGASFPRRDAVDTRIIDSYNAGNGSLASNGSYPQIPTVSSEELDSDKDGMSNEWEKSVGLDPNNPDDGNEDRNDDGYTNLEDFLNQVDFD